MFFKHLPIWLIIISATLSTFSCLELEEEVPEISLPPRNFNPHPYQNGYYESSIAQSGNTGPVLFPVNPPEASSIPDVRRFQGVVSNEIDAHPYATLARKKQYKITGRFHQQDNHVNPQVYKALASYASKVLTRPVAALKEYDDNPSPEVKKPYAFSYKVVDQATGDDFSHSQSQNADATRGEYRVKLPDGRVQIVSYTADKNGYKADVKYAENDNPVNYEQQQHTAVNSKAALNTLPIGYDHTYDEPQPVYETSVHHPPTHAGKINTNFNVYVTPKPFQHPNYYLGVTAAYPENFLRPTNEHEKFLVSTIQPQFSRRFNPVSTASPLSYGRKLSLLREAESFYQ